MRRERVETMRTDVGMRSELLDRLRAEGAHVTTKTGTEVDDDFDMLIAQAGDGLELLFDDGDAAVFGSPELTSLLRGPESEARCSYPFG